MRRVFWPALSLLSVKSGQIDSFLILVSLQMWRIICSTLTTTHNVSTSIQKSSWSLVFDIGSGTIYYKTLQVS